MVEYQNDFLKPSSPFRGTGGILAIESSCDETSAAICRDGKILSNVIAGQKVHEQYGGVVPELASRAHIQNIVPVVDQAIKLANENLKSDPDNYRDLNLKSIDAVA